MNAYMRRDEVRWTVTSALALVVCIVIAVARLVTVQGPRIPDPNARLAAKAADDRVVQAHACVVAAERLSSELDVFKATAKAAHLSPTPAPDPKPGKKDKEQTPDAELAWKSATPAHHQARALAPCRALVDQAIGARPDAGAVWDKIAAAASLNVPNDGDKPAQIAAARAILALTDVPIATVVQATRDTENALKTAALHEHERAQTATKQEPAPAGLLGRDTAITVGVGIGIIALLISAVSLRAATLRRMVTLVPLRDAARSLAPGMHTAEILRIAAQPSGGEPGLVLGAAIGGAVAALIWPLDPDLFVAGVWGGLIIGVGVQAVVRSMIGMSKWRQRAMDLGDVEKPTIPVVLALSGVGEALDAKFVRYLTALSPPEAAAAVERLAFEVEARILAAAEAGPIAPAPAAPAGGAAAHQAPPGTVQAPGPPPPGYSYPAHQPPPGPAVPPHGGYAPGANPPVGQPPGPSPAAPQGAPRPPGTGFPNR